MYLEHLQLKANPLPNMLRLLPCGRTNAWTKVWHGWNIWSRVASWDWSQAPAGSVKSALLKRFLHGLLPQQCQAIYCHLSTCLRRAC